LNRKKEKNKRELQSRSLQEKKKFSLSTKDVERINIEEKSIFPSRRGNGTQQNTARKGFRRLKKCLGTSSSRGLTPLTIRWAEIWGGV